MVKFELNNLKSRLDRAIMTNLGVNYSKAMEFITNKEVKVNGKRVKDNITIYEGDIVEVYTSIERQIETFFEDDNILIVYKDIGISTYDLIEKLIRQGQELHAVHRLDTNTQGLIMFAKNISAYESLKDTFERRELIKKYLAVTVGVPFRNEDKLIAYLKKDADKGVVQVFDMPGLSRTLIYTEYTIVEKYDEYALLDITLHTGRTHQIRAHLAHIGHPVLGDSKYGDIAANKKMKLKRQELVAYKIAFNEPEGALSYLAGKVFELKNPEERLSSLKIIKK